jgi:hypothetical protein
MNSSSSASEISFAEGQSGLLPDPYKSGAITRYLGASKSINARHWVELLAFACMQTTVVPEPASRTKGLVSGIGIQRLLLMTCATGLVARLLMG